MRTVTIWGCAILATVLYAMPARADDEQWLSYRKSAQPYHYLGWTAGWSTKMTDKPPEGVALPKFRGDKPRFSWWVRKEYAGGQFVQGKIVWLAWDQSGKGGYDLLYIDSNLDGSLADEKPIKADNVSQDGKRAMFPLVKVMVPGDDGLVACYLNIAKYEGTGDEVRYEAGGWYEGAVTIGGRKYFCRVIDNCCNGVFNDSGANRNQCDKIILVPYESRDEIGEMLNSSDKSPARFIGRWLELDGKWFAMEVARDGACVKFTPAEKVPTGTVRLGEGANESITVMGPTGQFTRKPKDGLVELPAGRYAVDEWSASKSDSRNVVWQLAFRGEPNKVVTFEVAEGKETAPDIGQKIVCEVDASFDGLEWRISPQLVSSGAVATLQRNGSQADAPKATIANADGTYKKTFTMEFG